MDHEEPMDFEEIKRTSGPKYRGVAVIAIFEEFHTSLQLNKIQYADIDKELLKDGFKDLQYGVIDLKNKKMTKDEFFKRLEDVSKNTVLEECETMALVIITHGCKNGKLYAFDKEFSREDVIDIFNHEKCIGLKGKLKLFIFHACRGNNYGSGVAHPSGNITKEKFPVAKLGDYIVKDNLILCSTFEGNIAFGPRKSDGSFFIGALSTVMKDEAKKMDSSRKNILKLLTAVIGIIARKNFGTDSKIITQQPTLMMALNQMYYFKKKENFPKEKLQTFLGNEQQ